MIHFRIDLDRFWIDWGVSFFFSLSPQAVTEIRALKRELRDTQSNLDGFEVAHLALKQQVRPAQSCSIPLNPAQFNRIEL